MKTLVAGASNVKESAEPGRRYQESVNAYFESRSSFWKDIYTDSSVYAEIHRDRRTAALDWIDSLALASGSRVLEIGCGAGSVAVALAQRGFRIQAIDSVVAMVELARQHAVESETTALVSVEIGDAYALAFEEDSFDLVLAIGVIPWLAHPELAIQEMARVMKPDGYAILTADNRTRLNSLLDPWLHPAFSTFKRHVKSLLVRARLRHQLLQDTGATSHDHRFIDETLAHAGLIKTRSMTLGFGPFSFLRCQVLPKSCGRMLHHQLQRLADQNVPPFRSTGAHYLVLARKSSSGSLAPSTSAWQRVSDTTVAL
jgi:ubiquinone/menaquinone biosynthesis C-methylase UbiE